MRKTNIIIALTVLLASCSLRYKKYHADWTIEAFIRNGVDMTSLCLSYNFKIHHGNKIAYLPSLYFENNKEYYSDDSPISFFSRNGEDGLEIKENDIFRGKYKMECLDAKCCQLRLSNDSTKIVLNYNGDIPHGRSRPCIERR